MQNCQLGLLWIAQLMHARLYCLLRLRANTEDMVKSKMSFEFAFPYPRRSFLPLSLVAMGTMRRRCRQQHVQFDIQSSNSMYV